MRFNYATKLNEVDGRDKPEWLYAIIFMTQFKRKIWVDTAQLNTIIYLIDRHLVNDDGDVRRKHGHNPCFTELLSNDLKQVGGRLQAPIKLYNNAYLRIKFLCSR